MSALLAAQDLSLARGDVQILSGLSLSVLRGEFVALLGPSGSGKSTLLKALGGVLVPDRGRVEVEGRPLGELSPAARAATIGSVPQDDIIHTALPLGRALSYAAQLRLPRDTPPAELTAAVDRVLAAIELTDRAGVRISRLSGGQRKRASLGVELLLAPPILLLDEPTSGLDPDLERTSMQLFRRLADEGRAIVCTTHSTDSLDLVHQLLIVVRGHLAFAGTLADALAHFQVPDPALIFKRLRDRRPEQWAQLYRQSPARQRARARSAPVSDPPGA